MKTESEYADPPRTARESLSAASVPTVISGSFDRCGFDGILGWAANPTRPGQTLEVEIFVDGHAAARGIADVLREDLAAAGVGDGKHGFAIALPKVLLDGKDHLVEVRELRSGQPLNGSPRNFRAEMNFVLAEREYAANGCLSRIASRIVIAGTGRSGTSILHSLLSRHPAIYSVPKESKFIVEGNGLQELVAALSEQYSVTGSYLALERFGQLMRNGLPRDWHYDKLIGEDIYYGNVRAFIDSLVDYEFNGIHMPRMFENREELLVLCRRFVDSMFGTPAFRLGKTSWLEKTPSNIIALDFLWELFPDATVVNIKRDPRGVFHSLTSQSWAPSEPDAVASYLGSIYLRWQRLKEHYDFSGRRYVEIKLEELVQRPNEILNAICTAAGLPPAAWNADDIDVTAPDNWKDSMPSESRRICEQRLGRYFPLMGYEL